MSRFNSLSLMDAPAVLDREEAVRRLNGDAGFFNDLAKLFVARLPDYWAELHRAAADRDIASLVRMAHRLRGVAGIFGADAAVRAARYLEEFASQEDDMGVESAADDLQHELHRLCSALQDTPE